MRFARSTPILISSLDCPPPSAMIPRPDHAIHTPQRKGGWTATTPSIQSGVAKIGSIVSAARCLVTVFRDTPVSRAISRIDSFCRRCIRRMMFKSPMWITPLPPPLTLWGKVHMAQFSMEIMRPTGSVLGGNQQVCHERTVERDGGLRRVVRGISTSGRIGETRRSDVQMFRRRQCGFMLAVPL